MLRRVTKKGKADPFCVGSRRNRVKRKPTRVGHMLRRGDPLANVLRPAAAALLKRTTQLSSDSGLGHVPARDDTSTAEDRMTLSLLKPTRIWHRLVMLQGKIYTKCRIKGEDGEDEIQASQLNQCCAWDRRAGRCWNFLISLLKAGKGEAFAIGNGSNVP